MSEKDYAVSSVGLPQVGKVMNKPRYLITLTAGKVMQQFIAMDKPDLQLGFVLVKGVYVDGTEAEITASFSETLASAPKETILDVMFPTHRVHCIKSLVFNANKPSTLIK